MKYSGELERNVSHRLLPPPPMFRTVQERSFVVPGATMPKSRVDDLSDSQAVEVGE